MARYRSERLDVGPHQLRGVQRLGGCPGYHDRQHLPDEPDGVHGYGRSAGFDREAGVGWRERLGSEVAAGHYGDDSRRGFGFGRVDGRDPAVGDGRSNGC